MVVYTSGTTGQPKGAMLSARNVIEVGRQLVAMLGTGRSDSTLSYLPLCHVAEKIFTIFQRLNHRDAYQGTGIGLALCKRIVQNHGGAIFASSQVDCGATFEVYLRSA